MKIIDFMQYKTDKRDFNRGSDLKQSIFMDGKFYMVKLPNEISDPNSLQTSVSNNVVSEYIGSHIMQALGLDAQNTLLGMWGNQIVVACEDIEMRGNILHEFSWYMKPPIIKANEIGRIPTYEQLYKVFNECQELQSIRQECIERYWDTIVGDALIGNFDRHKDNFGYLRNVDTDEIKPAPIYDCGSSLYPSLAESKFEKILSDPVEIDQRIYEYPKIALNRNTNKNREEKFGYYELLSSNFDKEFTRAFFGIYERLDMSKVLDIVDNTPFISDVRKHFYKTMLTLRKEKILDKSYEMLMERTEIKENSEFYFSRCKNTIPPSSPNFGSSGSRKNLKFDIER